MKLKYLLPLIVAHLGMTLCGGNNPIFNLCPEDITFHLSYDTNTAEADMACGEGKPAKEVVQAEFLPSGVFGGSALKQGCFYYSSKGNFQPNQSGTLIVWVSPQDWPVPAPDMTKKEPAFGIFGAGLVMGKQYNQKGGKSCLHFTAQYPKYSKGIHIHSEGNACQWQNKSWHMMIAVWDLASIALSIDGQPLKLVQLPEKAIDHSLFSVGSRYNDGYHVAIDELTILNRKLSDEEIAALYSEARKNIHLNP